MQNQHDERKKRVILWASVGGTMAVIVALWAFVLPRQLAALANDTGSPLSRWVVAREKTDLTQDSMTFKQVLEQQRHRLDALDQSQKESGMQGNTHIDELKAKIDGALNANEAVPSADEPADATANTNVSADANPQSPTPNP